MKIEAFKTSYCIGLTVEEFVRILDGDKKAFEDDEKDLSQKLDALDGVYDTDYNGHFGPNVFVTIDKENDNMDTWSKIKELVKEATSPPPTLYPLGDRPPGIRLRDLRNLKAVSTGVKRCPLKGEWFLSGAVIHAYRAPNDLPNEYLIAEIITLKG